MSDTFTHSTPRPSLSCPALPCRITHPNKARLPSVLWDFLGSTIWAGIKVGGDVSRLLRSYDGAQRLRTADLSKVDRDGHKFSSLSEVVEWACGKPMDKALQTSDWEHRLLTTAQKTYATLDVVAPLVAVHKFAVEGFVATVRHHFEGGRFVRRPFVQLLRLRDAAQSSAVAASVAILTSDTASPAKPNERTLSEGARPTYLLPSPGPEPAPFYPCHRTDRADASPRGDAGQRVWGQEGRLLQGCRGGPRPVREEWEGVSWLRCSMARWRQ